MPTAQPRILEKPSRRALFLHFRLRPEGPGEGLERLAEGVELAHTVVGLGLPLLQLLGVEIPAFQAFTPLVGAGVVWPATQGALWLALYGEDEGELLQESRRLLALLGSGFEVEDCISAYQYREGRDLSGYLDGTANPEGEAALQVALVDGSEGLSGSSFVFTQRWVHDLDALGAMSQQQRDHMIGRRHSDNEEIADAPESAHVKRTAQEEVGFLLRRSMPWGSPERAGLAFVAYSRDPEVFWAHGRRMMGQEDGILDALYRFSRPVSGSLYWCPPTRDGRLDLRFFGS